MMHSVWWVPPATPNAGLITGAPAHDPAAPPQHLSRVGAHPLFRPIRFAAIWSILYSCHIFLLCGVNIVRHRFAGVTVPATPYHEEFDTLFLSHYDEVYRLLYRIAGSQQEAEDLAQETFLRLYHESFEAGREHNVRAWLYRVATNLAYNAQRSRHRRHERETAVAHERVVFGEMPADPADLALRRDARETVRDVLATLPERTATLLLLRHAGLSYRELADVLDVAPGSIGTMLARATSAFEDAYRTKVKEEEHDL